MLLKQSKIPITVKVEVLLKSPHCSPKFFKENADSILWISIHMEENLFLITHSELN
jgi:hypothetical protein